MKKIFSWKVGAALFTAAFLLLLTGAVRYNLSVSTAAIMEKSPIIVIDAGHGGEDGGAIGTKGVPESQINLDISMGLDQLLRFCGYRTKMIRDSDRSVYTEGETLAEKKVSDLKHRVKLVNGTWNALLISIHQNHFPEEKYSGAQVFYGSVSGGKELAGRIQEQLRLGLDPDNHRQIKKADAVYLMEKITCPGVLVECGFLSNPKEEALLLTSAYQRKIICAVTSALNQYLSEGETEFEV